MFGKVKEIRLSSFLKDTLHAYPTASAIDHSETLVSPYCAPSFSNILSNSQETLFWLKYRHLPLWLSIFLIPVLTGSSYVTLVLQQNLIQNHPSLLLILLLLRFSHYAIHTIRVAPDLSFCSLCSIFLLLLVLILAVIDTVFRTVHKYVFLTNFVQCLVLEYFGICLPFKFEFWSNCVHYGMVFNSDAPNSLFGFDLMCLTDNPETLNWLNVFSFLSLRYFFFNPFSTIVSLYGYAFHLPQHAANITMPLFWSILVSHKN